MYKILYKIEKALASPMILDKQYLHDRLGRNKTCIILHKSHRVCMYNSEQAINTRK